MKKYFININTLEELKKEYRKLMFIHHPDRGGNTIIAQEINAEYDSLFEVLKNKQETTTGTEHNENINEYKDIINELVKYPGLEINIIGTWIWVTGNTLKYKNNLKELGFRWSRPKESWYYSQKVTSKRRGHSSTMDDLKNKYGCETMKSTGSKKAVLGALKVLFVIISTIFDTISYIMTIKSL